VLSVLLRFLDSNYPVGISKPLVIVLFVLFVLSFGSIVLSVLLRFPDSNYPVDIFKPLVIVLFVILRLTASDYSFGTFKPFWCKVMTCVQILNNSSNWHNDKCKPKAEKKAGSNNRCFGGLVCFIRKVWRYLTGAIHARTENTMAKILGQKDKHRSTKHYLETKSWATRNPLKTGVPFPHVALIVLPGVHI
jgi:hypothetical protein